MPSPRTSVQRWPVPARWMNTRHLQHWLDLPLAGVRQALRAAGVADARGFPMPDAVRDGVARFSSTGRTGTRVEWNRPALARRLLAAGVPTNLPEREHLRAVASKAGRDLRGAGPFPRGDAAGRRALHAAGRRLAEGVAAVPEGDRAVFVRDVEKALAAQGHPEEAVEALLEEAGLAAWSRSARLESGLPASHRPGARSRL